MRTGLTVLRPDYVKYSKTEVDRMIVKSTLLSRKNPSILLLPKPLLRVRSGEPINVCPFSQTRQQLPSFRKTMSYLLKKNKQKYKKEYR